MKKIYLLLCGMLVLCVPTLATADMLVGDANSFDEWENPQSLSNSGAAYEEAWLEALLGSEVELTGRDEKEDDGWQIPDDWTYIILKYGAPQAPLSGISHYAIYNDDGGSGLDLVSLNLNTPNINFTYHALSHISYDGTVPVPEPATMLLLGTGLIGLAGVGRKKFFKK